MISALTQLALPALLALDPETAHEATLKALELGLYPADRTADPSTLASRLGELVLTNPIAIAAGFDKDARVPDAVLGLGCGFAEIGTVTPLAQPGNPPTEEAARKRWEYQRDDLRDAALDVFERASTSAVVELIANHADDDRRAVRLALLDILEELSDLPDALRPQVARWADDGLSDDISSRAKQLLADRR